MRQPHRPYSGFGVIYSILCETCQVTTLRETLLWGAVLTQVTLESTINRVANEGQLTPSQETVGRRLLGHAVIRTFDGACIPSSRTLSYPCERDLGYAKVNEDVHAAVSRPSRQETSLQLLANDRDRCNDHGSEGIEIAISHPTKLAGLRL